jgi:CRISPR-associated protein Cas1
MHLILNSYGAMLSREDGLFLVSTPDGRQLLPPDRVTTISVGRAVRITSDAILMAIEHEIDVLFVTDSGQPEGRVWSVRYGSVSDMRRAQLDFIYGPHVMQWVRELLAEKLNNQIALLLAFQPDADADMPVHNAIRAAINAIEDHRGKILRAEGESLSDIAPSLRGWEGAAGRKYFEALNAVLPVAYRFQGRSRVPATDMFNSMLNYSYGMLYGKVEGAIIKAGLDPYAGIFHRDDYNRPALVFDMIEKYRMWTDFVVVQLCRMQAIPPDLFGTDTDTGACMMLPLGKRILIQAVNDYLAEVVDLGGLPRSRMTHLELQQQQFAQYLLARRPDRSADGGLNK